MKLTRIRAVGRFHNRVTGQTVNIRKGTRVGRGTDIYFFLHRGVRQYVDENEIHASGGHTPMWKRVDMPQPPCCGGNDEAFEHAHTMDCDVSPGEPIPAPVLKRWKATKEPP